MGGSPWPRYQRLEARCVQNLNQGIREAIRGHFSHFAPNPDCQCGIHAGITLRKALEYLPRPSTNPEIFSVLAQVSLWGHVVVNARGYRAQYAYPKKIWLVAGNERFDNRSQFVAEDIEEDYGVEVAVTTRRAIKTALLDADRLIRAPEIPELPRYMPNFYGEGY